MWQTKQNRHLPNAVWLARLDVWLCDLVAVAVCAVSVHLPAYACECCIRMWSSAFVCACLCVCVCCLCSCRAASFDSVATNYRRTHTHSEYVCWPLSCAAVWHSYVIWTHRMAVDCWLMYCKNLFWYSIHWFFGWTLFIFSLHLGYSANVVCVWQRSVYDDDDRYIWHVYVGGAWSLFALPLVDCVHGEPGVGIWENILWTRNYNQIEENPTFFSIQVKLYPTSWSYPALPEANK